MSWFLLLALLLGLSAASVNFTAVFEWENIDFVWPSEDFRKEALRKGDYVPENFFPSDHVVYGERVFISIYKSTDYPTPFTLTWLPLSASSKSPKLNPFSTWIMHEKGNCDAMQEIRDIVADVCGRLWAIDRGNELCPAKLWIFDLTENDSVSLVHQFANEIVSHTSSKRELDSLDLDETPNDTLAYIPDFRSGKIIVFSLKNNVSWAIQIKDISITSIALSPIKGKELAYLGHRDKSELYSVPLSELRTRGKNTLLTPRNSLLVGKKTAGSLRMLMDNNGKLYFDLIGMNYIGTWDTTAPFKEEQFYKDERLTTYGFPFSFAFDTCNNLWILTREKKKETNFRLLRAAVGVKSHLYTDLVTPKGCGRVSSNYSTKIYEDSIEKNDFNIAYLVCLAVSCIISCCIILWLALWVKRLKKTTARTRNELQEMSVFPPDNVVEREQVDDDNNYDDVAPPDDASTSVQVELGTARPYSDPHIYDQVLPSPPGSELYLRLEDEPHH